MRKVIFFGRDVAELLDGERLGRLRLLVEGSSVMGKGSRAGLVCV